MPQEELQAPIDNGQSSFSRTTVDINNLTSRAFDTKRRFFEARVRLSNTQKLFTQRVIAKTEMQLAENEFKIATQEIDNFASQLSVAIRGHEELLETLSQERALIEQQIADIKIFSSGMRGVTDPVLASKRELLQNQRQGFSVRNSIDQLEALAEIIQDRDEEDTPPMLPVAPPAELAPPKPPAELALPKTDSGA